MNSAAPTLRAKDMEIQKLRADVAELVKALTGTVSILTAVKFSAGLQGNQITRLDAAKALLKKHGA